MERALALSRIGQDLDTENAEKKDLTSHFCQPALLSSFDPLQSFLIPSEHEL